MAKVDCICKWCGGPFKAKTADRARGWAQCCKKSCAASLKTFGHNKAFWEKVNPNNKRSNIQKYADRLLEVEAIDYEGGGWDAHKGVH